jgi:competence protein ComGC
MSQCPAVRLMKGFVHIVAIIVIAVIVVLLLMIELHVGPWAGSATSTGGTKADISESI